MATKKDLVEAHAFSKRRLITAFVSGAPGGREVEPVRPGRVLIGGIALSVLLLAGAAIAGFLIGRPNSAWLEEGSFVISKETGERYVVLRGGEDPRLQRVPNYLSAQLLLGEPELTANRVSDTYIREVALGSDLGIDGAPTLPAASDLIDEGWTACTAADTGIKLTITEDPDIAELRQSAFLVSSGGGLWLVAPSPGGSGYRLRLPADATDAGVIADRLGFGATSQAPVVPEEWLNLFPAGPALDVASFGIDATDIGGAATYPGAETDLSRFRVGDLVRTPSRSYLLGPDGPIPLSEFAAVVYDSVGSDTQDLDEDLRVAPADTTYPDQWPTDTPVSDEGPDMCAVLHPGADGEAAEVKLAGTPRGEVAATGIGPNSHEVDVAPSGGAYVRSGADEAATDGTPYVIDTKAQKYALVGPDVALYIGYGDSAAPVVPNTWLEFFEEGTSLSVNGARRVPEDAPATTDSDAS
ncbi:type VII secretion protein EccB [Nocardioides sp. P5_C9_2]